MRPKRERSLTMKPLIMILRKINQTKDRVELVIELKKPLSKETKRWVEFMVEELKKRNK